MLDYVWFLPAKTSTNSKLEWLPLVTHLMDTAFVMQKLTNDWLPKCVPEMLGFSTEEFYKVASFLALTHDLGKCTPAFASKLLMKLEEIRYPLETASLDIPDGMLNASQVLHGHAGAVLLRQNHFPRSIAAVVGAHHGRPESSEQTEDGEEIEYYGKCYFGNKGSRWKVAQTELITWALRESGYTSAENLPKLSFPAQMIITGLVIMADWIASNTRYFPLIPIDSFPKAYDSHRAERALDCFDLPSPWQIGNDWKEMKFFPQRFGFEPNLMQSVTMEIAASMSQPGCMILEAPMGIGKTEAALATVEIWMSRFQLGGVEFFLPSQATSNAMFNRLISWIGKVPHESNISVELAHSMAEMNSEFVALQQGSVIVEQDGKESLTVHSFFRGRKTWLLAELVVGTIDQMLMAGLKQKHVMLRHLGLVGKVIIIDEVHAYDAYMNSYLDCVLAWLGAYKVPVILLSATLPKKRRQELIEAYQNIRRRRRSILREENQEEAYPMITWTDGLQICQRPIVLRGVERIITVERIEEAKMVDEVVRSLNAGACVGIIVNTVRRAQFMMQTFAKALPNVTILLDHSCFLALDRVDCETEIVKRAGKHSDARDRQGVLIIGTQVLEQSLDVDFDLLVTDLCPMDLLLQRAGRLHRHVRTRPEALQIARLIVLHAGGTLEDGAKAIYWEYLLERTSELLPEQFQIPGDISPLVQETYDEAKWAKEAKEAYEKKKEKKKQKANCYRLDRPGIALSDDTIAGLLDDVPGMSELEARATVRDGEASIEVLVVGVAEEGAMLLSGDNRGEVLSMTDTPCTEDARRIACQRLRLPQYFARHHMVDRVISHLQEQTARMVPEWESAPLLEGELFLFLDKDGNGVLPGYNLHYDTRMGLTYEEAKNGSD